MRRKGTRYLTGHGGNSAQREKFSLMCRRCCVLRLSSGLCVLCRTTITTK